MSVVGGGEPDPLGSLRETTRLTLSRHFVGLGANELSCKIAYSTGRSGLIHGFRRTEVARKAKATTWTRTALLDALSQLPDHAPISEAFPGSGVPLKEKWIGWVSDYNRGRLKKNPSARTIYNRVQQPRWIIWLAEASGINARLIRKAINSVARHVIRQTQAKETRRILPWTLVARHLEQMTSSRQLPRRTVTNIDLTEDRTSLVAELEQIRRIKDQTTRKCLIDAGLGQGQFRVDVEKLWRGARGVTGCRISAVLRASHIKPWSQSTNEERLNPENGILLAAHIDALFDRGLITFLDNGTMLISKRVSDRDRKLLRLSGRLRCPPKKGLRHFLGRHRRNFLERERYGE
ncbi:HNH endonuclease [Bradyrhizobium erythrophlei]|uniref:HNH endonuclease n=1 Tax=Bradyrhizobium erythrophlei TaxID=1437360 RepID=A0A1M5JSL2_9BRAD|nr:HNH endonuclease [Bradyrhizobium erythrophlei]